MEMRRCEKGHFYDAKRTPTCPYCSGDSGSINLTRPANGGSQDISKTMAVSDNNRDVQPEKPAGGQPNGAPNAGMVNQGAPNGGMQNQGTPNMNVPPAGNPNMAAQPQIGMVNNNYEKTVALMKKDTGLDPVVGWLVCIEGADKGRDYRIHAERNFIGRSEKMDICIRGDETISRDAHAIVSYDLRKNTFRLYQGDSKGIIYVNDEEVVTAVVLQPQDIIEMGKTKLLFIPLCGEKFKWE